jgi:hypothetical protein
MPLPERCIQEFRQLWKEVNGVDLDYEVAAQEAEALIAVLRHAYLPQSIGPPRNNGPP